MRKIIYLTGAFVLALAVSCHGGDGHGHSDEHSHSDEHAHLEEEAHSGESHSDEIVLSPEKAEAAGVVAETVVPGIFYGVVPVSGKITEAQGDEISVAANVSGIVSFISPVVEGLRVSENSPLLSISGKNLQEGDQAERIRIAYETAKLNYERACELVGDKIVSEKDYYAAKAEYENARLAYDAVSRNAGEGTALLSPVSGYVKEVSVAPGEYVSVGQPVMKIARSGRMYLRADLPERHYGILDRITSAKFRTGYSDKVYDVKELGGSLLSFGKSSSSASPYIPVTFVFNSADGLVPGAYAEVFLLTGARENVLSLPVSAITEEQGVNFVYVREDETCYRKAEVVLGESDGERVEVLSGLKGGENVVVKGAIYVKLASASNAIPAHTHNH